MPSTQITKIITDSFSKAFNNRIGSCFECCEAESLLKDISDFIKLSLDKMELQMTIDFLKTINKLK